MSESIKVDGCSCSNPEIFFKILTSQKYLPDKGLSRGHIAVRLQVPATNDMPSACCHMLFYPFKKLRLVFLNPLVQNNLVMIKYKPVKFVTKIGGRPEGGYRRGSSFLPFPLPHRINVSVAYQMNFFHDLFLHFMLVAKYFS